ncbi:MULTISPECIES: GIDE domain-containing protein [Thermomonospora]|uniref:RING-type E3 ubiquitin transferase n=1 Tax=Thermomonospora cellulosilytica TaxID=1411118 RepID=A0A7W3MUX7_9ACTN|nr:MULTISPECIES: GIDE domain-containing protein [Thermomonospora]MBA9002302.1 hypothetical protein [Thermomonospora cellulosilytica]
MYILVALFGAFFLAVGWIGRMQLTAMARSVTRTCAELTAHGPFTTKCEVAGTVRAPGGPILTAPFSGRPCVWYRVKATAKYRDGGTNPFLKESSDQPFELWDDTGGIDVFPGTTDVHGTEKTLDAKISSDERTHLPVPDGHPDRYREYHYEEWTLPVGSPLYVRGKAVFDGMRLSMRAPTAEPSTTDPYILSTRSEKQLRRRALAIMVTGYGGGALLVALAAVVAVLESN